MDSDESTVGATQSCSIGGPRCSSVSSNTAADDDDDYGIPPWEQDPFGEGEQEKVEEALSEGWRRKAYRELQEKPEWRQRDIEELRNMVRGMQRKFEVGTDIAPTKSIPTYQMSKSWFAQRKMLSCSDF